MGSRLDKNSAAVSKAIQNHDFENEEGDEYEPSKFGGFPEYFRRKKIKLQNLDAQIRAESAGEPQIFRGIVCHVNGYTQPSLNDIHRMVVSHGGGFMQYLDGKTQVTHVIASNLTPKKAVEFKRYRIVKPAWIVDSLQAGRLLPWENYRVVDEGAGQKVLHFDNGKLDSQVNHMQKGYRDQTDKSWYTRQLAQEQEDEAGPSNEVIDDLDGLDFSSYDAEHESSADKRKGEAVNTKGRLPKVENAAADTDAISADGDIPAQLDPIDSPSSHDKAAKYIPLDTSERNTLLGRSIGRQDALATLAAPEPASEPNEGPQHLPHDDEQFPSGNMATSASSKRKAEMDASNDSKRLRMTAEQHNTELLSDPRIRKSSVLNPDFLEQYYRESRLHHLSTWKAALKSQLQAITSEKSASQKARSKGPSSARRYVLHVDFDSFFVAVSLKNFPQHRDKPAVVAHGSGSGSEIASCNYPARTFGVKNGMWMKRAQELCDTLQVLPYDFPAYEASSRLFYDAILNTGGIVQSVSIDEALIDVSSMCHSAGGSDGSAVREGSIWREQQKADEIAQALRDTVKQQTECAVSVGIGGNILLAKVALRKAKPAGQYHIKPEQVLDFLGPLQVQDLPGVAHSIGGKLEEVGVKFIRDIRELTKERLIAILGPKTGEKLYNYARGIDKAEVGDQVVRKSVSAEVNWGVRFETQEQADEFIESLCGELNRRLLKEKVRGRNLTMKVMRRAADAPLDPPKHLGHGKCDTFNKSVALGVATNDKEVLSKEALSMLRSFGFSPGELRGLGIQMTKLDPIKATTDVQGDGSQRRLQFNMPAAIRSPAQPNSHDKQGGAGDADLQSSQRRQHFKASQQAPAADADDIQDDPETPRKEQRHSLVPPQFVDTPSKKALNITGTQFIMPTQVDPEVLSELPKDIRDRLTKDLKQSRSQQRLDFARIENRQRRSSEDSGDEHERLPFAATALPSESQLDPSILAALPEEMRAEILSQYAKSDIMARPPAGVPKGARAAQAVLPQSPRKLRTALVAPFRGRGRPRGGSLLSRMKASSNNGGTLTQANFVAARHIDSAGGTESDSDTNVVGREDAVDGPDPDFLAALPPDIRAEVIAQHRAASLRRTGGLEVARRRGRAPATAEATGPRVVRLEPRAVRPTFTTAKLWKVDELRQAVKEWVEEFSEDGPYDEDVDALVRYLSDVVAKEGDSRKSIDICRWLGWVVDQSIRDSATATRDKWHCAADKAKQAIQTAVTARGLGKVDFR